MKACVFKNKLSRDFCGTKITLSQNERVAQVMQVLLGFALILAASEIRVPIGLVPVTLQTAAVLFVSIVLPSQVAVGSVGLYLVAGFSLGQISWISPTAGYLIGFIFSAYLTSGLNNFSLTSRIIIGLTVIYACGVCWLASWVGIQKAFEFGLLPFIFPEILKCSLLRLALATWRR